LNIVDEGPTYYFNIPIAYYSTSIIDHYNSVYLLHILCSTISWQCGRRLVSPIYYLYRPIYYIINNIIVYTYLLRFWYVLFTCRPAPVRTAWFRAKLFAPQIPGGWATKVGGLINIVLAVPSNCGRNVCCSAIVCILFHNDSVQGKYKFIRRLYYLLYYIVTRWPSARLNNNNNTKSSNCSTYI